VSTDTALASPTASGDVGESHHDEHGLSFAAAIKLAIFLAVVTGLETLTYFVDFGAIAEPLIIILMIIKFATVVAYFMHLRYENWLFTLLFMIGIVVALGVYLVALITLQVF